MKYIIELNTSERDIICSLIRGIRDNSLGDYRLFEDTTLCAFNKDSIDYDAVYRKGIEDGNKIADRDLKEIQDSTFDVAYNEALKDVDHAVDVLKSMTGTECAEWFEDCVGVDEVVCGFTVQRIVEITKAYEEKKKSEEIKVGDVVQQKGAIMIVTRVNNIAKTISGINKDGEYFERDMYKWHKTGRHFDEVSLLLDKLKG